MNHTIIPCKPIFCILLLLCFCQLAIAQKADFTIDKPNGCPGLSVKFTNTSTGFSASATYKWDFGNGNTSVLKDPGTTYNTSKDYTVTLTVTEGSKTDMKTNTVSVYNIPTVDFTTSVASGCQPLPVTFTSTSAAGDGTIASYYWDYGDGNSESAGAQQQHIYNIPQTVTASLTVTNSHGCYNIVSKPEIVKVFPSVTASFSAAQTVLCKATDADLFTNTSTGSGTLKYEWDFGDGTTSTDENPNHVFTKKGIYTIKLGAKSSDGCKNETIQTDYINVANFTTDFSVPALICQNTNATFTNTSNPQNSFNQSWLVDGNYSYGYNQFSYSFSKEGPHIVQLINTYGTCIDTGTKTINVQPSPVANNFIADLQGACGSPVTVKFKDTTTGAIKWAWDFNYNYSFNTTSTVQTPSYTYTTDGTYSVQLQVTNAAGCSANLYKYLSIYHNNANIYSSKGNYGCTNLASVFSVGSQTPIKDYAWDFGDGTSSTIAMPSHTFTKEGYYNIKLAYTDTNGCKSTTNYSVSVLGKPSFDFSVPTGTTICGNTLVNFVVTGTNTNGYYSWHYGDYDGYYYSISASHQYYLDTTFTVSLIIANDGCADTVTKENYIKVLPPFPKIATQQNTCDGTRGLVTFTESSVKSTGWTWDFGDGSATYSYTSFQDTIKHTYSKTGSYKTVLIAKNGSCVVRDSVTTYVLLKQKPVLSSAQTEVCGSANLPVTVANLETNPYNNYNYNYYLNHFEYGDSTTFNGNVYSSSYYEIQNNSQLTLSNLDNTKKDLRLIIYSYNFSCSDTTNYIAIKVTGPSAGYELADNNKCFKTPLRFLDTSKGSNGVPIIKWDWSFGDGQIATTTGGNVSHIYTAPNSYYTSLTVTDKDGCTAISQHYDAITSGTKAVFNVSQNPVLPNIPINFYNYSYGGNYYGNLYTWQLGEGDNQSGVSYYTGLTHSYANTGIDTVRLIVKDEATSCIDTAVQLINVKNTNLSYSVTTSFINPGSGCPPTLAKFTNTSNNVASVKWDFGDGATADNLNYPSHIYQKPGNYKVTIYGYFYDNSVDSSFDYVTIAGPYATLKADKLFTCGSSTPITLSAEANNTTAYTWDFGDGTLVDATDTFATHTYLTAGVYTPSLIVKDGNNCSFPFFLSQPVVIDTLHLAINKTPSITCDSSLTLFTPDITSVAKNDLGQTLTYFWNFGTANAKDTANTEAASFVYSDTGSYAVSFRAASPYGCIEEASVQVLVKPTPHGSITGITSICEGLTTAFNGMADISNNGITWQWIFPNGNTSSSQNPAAQIFPVPGLQSVQMIVNNAGCSDTVNYAVTVYAKPAIAIAPATPFVCAGSAIQLEAHDGIIYSWLPAANISNAGIANPLVSPAVTTQYNVQVTNEKGCVNTDSITVRVRQPFAVSTASPLYLCKGSSLQLNATGADTYQWAGTDLDNTAIASPTTITQTPQTYTVVGFDNDHCFTDTATSEIRIAALPSVKSIEDITVFAGSPVDLTTTGSNDITAWSWTPADYLNCAGCISPTSHPKSEVLYIVKATTNYGCSKMDSVHINIICKQSLVQIPGAFTPGGDGKNDRFVIKGQGIKLISRFVIFNRSGVPVFQKTNVSANDSSAGWDGTFNGRGADVGSYVYMADILCDTGEVFHYKGTVVLIR